MRSLVTVYERRSVTFSYNVNAIAERYREILKVQPTKLRVLLRFVEFRKWSRRMLLVFFLQWPTAVSACQSTLNVNEEAARKQPQLSQRTRRLCIGQPHKTLDSQVIVRVHMVHASKRSERFFKLAIAHAIRIFRLTTKEACLTYQRCRRVTYNGFAV